jgi:trk system potassium uptake protein TrkH
VRWAAIQRLLGVLVAFFSLTMLPPMAVALFAEDGQFSVFAITFLITLGSGLIAWYPVRRDRSELRTRDGFLVVALFWTVLGFFGSVPLMLGPHLSLTDAVFESVSGFTTTGATVIIGLDLMPPSILYHRQQLQWLGGMGVVVLAVAILPMLGVGGMQLYRAEVPGPVKEDKLSPRIMNTARTLWYIYLGLTVACALAYWLAGMSVFDAVAHAFSTISTAGYSTHDASLAHFNSVAIETIAIVFMLLGAVNFGIHFVVWQRRDLRLWWRDSETRTMVLIVLAAALTVCLILLVTAGYASPQSAFRDSLFQVVSVMTTTGFTTANWAEWPLFVPLLLAALSYIGGCAGSTAGGLKVMRIMLMYKQGIREAFHLIHPRALHPVKIGGRVVEEPVLNSVWGFYSLYVLSALILTGLAMAAGLDLESAFGAVTATLNLLGPGLGEVATTFATVPDFVKWIGIFAMLLGRLEVFTLFILMTPAFWRN